MFNNCSLISPKFVGFSPKFVGFSPKFVGFSPKFVGFKTVTPYKQDVVELHQVF
jgi:hypothetical protein